MIHLIQSSEREREMRNLQPKQQAACSSAVRVESVMPGLTKQTKVNKPILRNLQPW